MKSLPVVVATLFATLLVFSVVPAAFANDMNAVLVPQVDKGETHFIAVKNITFRYPADSAIAQELNGKQDRIQFTVSGNSSSTDNGVASAITAFNRALLQAQSPAMVTNMTITYTGTIRGFPDNALMTVKVEAVPNIEKFVISGGNSGGNQSTATSSAVDLEWRGLSVTDPIVLIAPDVGQIEITKPINLVDKLHKDLAKQIFESQASSMFTPSIINFDKFKQPMNTWHVLFDPSGRLVETSSFFAAENTAKVVSTYSLGESSFREGTFQPEESDATASIGGAQVQFHSQVPAPSGQIQIAGYAKLDQATGGNVALVTTDAPEGVTQSSGNFPIQVLLVLGGMMGAIAVFILFKARK